MTDENCTITDDLDGPPTWALISEAPKYEDGEVLVWVSPRGGLAGFITWCAWHPDAGWCADELREVTHYMRGSARRKRAISEKNAGEFDGLVRLAGYVQDGSQTTVKLSLDDATGTAHITVGTRRYWGDTFRGALLKAIAAEGQADDLQG